LPVTNVFGYNPRSEVTEALMGDDTYGYSYDPLGNRTVTTENLETTEYAVNNLNQYSQISVPSVPSVVNPSYDMDGNLLTNGVWSFTWDAENRLVSACSNNVLRVRNTYDSRSRRIRKEVSVYNASTGNYEPVTCNSILWDGWNVFREVRDQMSEVSTNYYTWGSDLSGSLQGAGGVGGLLSVTTVSAADPQPVIYFPLFDANGNVTEYISTNGTVAARYAYDAFGATVAQSGDMADAFTHRFSTKPFDAETGLVMYQLRPYEPGLGRWLSRDPIEEEGANLFCFVSNSPIVLADLLGLTAVSLETPYGHGMGPNAGVADIILTTEDICESDKSGKLKLDLVFYSNSSALMNTAAISRDAAIWVDGKDVTHLMAGNSYKNSPSLVDQNGKPVNYKAATMYSLVEPIVYELNECDATKSGHIVIELRWKQMSGWNRSISGSRIDANWKYSCKKNGSSCCGVEEPFTYTLKHVGSGGGKPTDIPSVIGTW
jgi:RHS repeat-associated protein